MTRSSEAFGRSAIVRSLPVQFLLLLMALTLSVGAAGATVWIGPALGLDTPVFKAGGERDGHDHPGKGLDVNVRVTRMYDLLLGVYISDLVAGNDADPVWGPILGVRRRIPLGSQGGTLCPFASVGAGVIFAQAGFGLEIAPRSSPGLEIGVRDVFSTLNSLQAYVHIRIGRMPPPRLRDRHRDVGVEEP